MGESFTHFTFQATCSVLRAVEARDVRAACRGGPVCDVLEVRIETVTHRSFKPSVSNRVAKSYIPIVLPLLFLLFFPQASCFISSSLSSSYLPRLYLSSLRRQARHRRNTKSIHLH